ncbi:hypothetical protein [Clostridium sp.]|uniref:hypothetical protein n=1 Tax=Clostridium sp. TaxID=1506 RepID=UPI003217E3C0
MKINAMGIDISQNNCINKTSALFKNIKVDEDKKESKNLKLNNKIVKMSYLIILKR